MGFERDTRMALADFARCTLDVDAKSLTREVRSDAPIFPRALEERWCPARGFFKRAARGCTGVK